MKQPAEWEAHRSCWSAWPSHRDLWLENLVLAQQEFASLCRAIADVDPATGKARGESLDILVPDPAARAQAEAALHGLPVRFHDVPFGDIWLRDTGPIFLKDSRGQGSAARFVFNGWGGKYVLPFDTEVAARVAALASRPTASHPWVLEGGSVEADGEGTCLTTRQCLLNPNRNPEMGELEVEQALRRALGAEKVLWLEDGLLNDHTDGHIDTLARFSRPGTVLCMEARDADDPNREVMDRIARDLAKMKDARGRQLEVVRVPSPGAVLNEDGEVMPASYMNFYIANTTVVVPVYGSPRDVEAVEAIGRCFPGRKTVGLRAKTILSGGGAFHCITQQEPL